MHELFEQLKSAIDRDEPVAYTALVETRGSTPQKAGAAMLVFADGRQVGTLGGGCVEAEVKREAIARLRGASAELLTFQLDSDYGWDDGLICGGRMTMLVAPLTDAAERRYFETYHRLVTSAAGCIEAVVMDPERTGLPAAARYLFDRDGQLAASTTGAPPSPLVAAHLKSLAERPRPYVTGGLSYLPSLTRCRLIVVGGGHVGQKVAELAAEVDFDVWVIDDREQYCHPARFPRAQRLLVGPIEEVLGQLEMTPDTFCIIVTRGHQHDEQALAQVVERPARYVGMIGSKRKIRLIFDDLRRNGVSEEALARVHAPIGFDIGSQSVPEIGVSIVAELIAVRNLGHRGHSRAIASAGEAAVSSTREC
jgi:xanthine dehydrogenase accessory factor